MAFLLFSETGFCQQAIDSFRMFHDVKITIDRPALVYKQTLLVFFALPNGNTTEETMGKKILPGDDWHFDIQHIRAQTDFLRMNLHKNIVVAYLENDYRSWPLWKQKHPLYAGEIRHIVDTVFRALPGRKISVCLSGHSGGGSFLFGYLDGGSDIPSSVGRIAFIDSDYGYDSRYDERLRTWLMNNKKASLLVFAYNDSVALFNNRPVVSEKGGTWYRSHLMMQDLQKSFALRQTRNDSLVVYESTDHRIAFFLKTNPDQKIYHTQQVERNGFIHSVLYGTGKENRGYEYFGPRAYTSLIR